MCAMDHKSVKMKQLNILAYMIATLVGLLFYAVSWFVEFDYIYVLCLCCCVCYCVSLFCFVQVKGVASISCLFWLCLFVFGCSRLFLYVFGSFDFMSAPYGILGNFYWSKDTAIAVICYYFAFMGVFSTVVLKAEKKTAQSTLHCVAENDICDTLKAHPFGSLHQAMYLIYYICVPLVIIFYLTQVLLVMRYGYVSLYNGTINKVLPFLSIFSIVRLAFTVAYYAILSFERREKQFLVAAGVYLVINAMLLAQGSRAGLITSAFTFLVLYCSRFKRKFKFSWLVIVLVVGIPLLEIVSYVRSGQVLTLERLLGSYSNFLSELSGSFNIPAYYLQNKEALSINSYPYIMEPIVKLVQYYQHVDVYSGGQSQAMIDVRFNLGHQISYHVSPGYYLQGNNFASNLIAEMAEFGIFGVVFFSYIFARTIRFIENGIQNHSPYICYMSTEFCGWIFMAPRASAFYDTYNLFKWGLIYIVLMIGGSFFVKKIQRRKITDAQ